MPAPASRTNDAAICVTANTRSRRLVPRRDAHAAARQPQSVRRVGRRQARHERQQHGRGHREDDAHPEQARVHRDIVGAHGEARGVARQHATPSAARSTMASTAPAPHSSRLSASSVRRSAPVPAPSAARTASSPSRRTERARIRLATLEQATMKTSAEAASSTSSMVRAGEMIWSRRFTASMRKSACV